MKNAVSLHYVAYPLFVFGGMLEHLQVQLSFCSLFLCAGEELVDVGLGFGVYTKIVCSITYLCMLEKYQLPLPE